MIDASKVTGAFVPNEDGTYSISDAVSRVHKTMIRVGVPKLHKTGIRLVIQRIELMRRLETGGVFVNPEEVETCLGLEDASIEPVNSSQFTLREVSRFNASLFGDELVDEQEVA